MTDKHQTSQPLQTELLSVTLATLRSHGVSSAQFGREGQLLHVDFFPSAPTPGEDESTESVVKTVVDQGLAYLAARGQRRENGGES